MTQFKFIYSFTAVDTTFKAMKFKTVESNTEEEAKDRFLKDTSYLNSVEILDIEEINE